MILQSFSGEQVEGCCVLLIQCYIIFLGADFCICAPQLHVCKVTRCSVFLLAIDGPFYPLIFLNSQPPLSSPTVTLPSESCIGGGSSHLSCASYMIVSKTSFWNNQSCLAYVDDMGLKAYPTDKFFHASIPLQIVSQLLSIVTISRYVATMHHA